mmetsp:Transcript_4078/g.5325  ORF Transcript_4078/g.5325 Transcript_4078/m.5325 type:complete len:336 (+) Transcript_4078:91-1098(+)
MKQSSQIFIIFYYLIPPFFMALRCNGLKPIRSSNVSKPYLLEQAARIRRNSFALPKNSTPTNDNEQYITRIIQEYASPTSLFFPTFYKKANGGKRGFANYLLKNRVIIGQYPGQTPERDGPKLSYVQEHIQTLVSDTNVRLFCSLQSEVPPQDDTHAWAQVGGKVYFPINDGRKDFPEYFGHYAPLVQKAYSSLQKSYNNDEDIHRKSTSSGYSSRCEPPSYIHAPILDLNTPSSSSLYATLSILLQTLEDNPGCAIYIHCWGGRGRAGLIGACLLSLIFPELNASHILDWVQRGYDTRLGAELMPFGLKKSPQTLVQREFVHKFVQDVQNEFDL